MARIGLFVIAASMALTMPARAEYVHATYSGTIVQTGPAATAPFAPGTKVSFDLVYDRARLVDYTTGFSEVYGRRFRKVQAASLSDDPGASLTITVGGVSTFTMFDHIYYATPFGCCNPKACRARGLGIGRLPAVIYLNGSFAGVGNIFVNAAGLSLDADPISDVLLGGFGLAGPKKGRFAFFIGKGTAAHPFTQGLAVGNIDLTSLTLSPVAEAKPGRKARPAG